MYSPITFAFPLKSLSRISEMEARDAAHASGCPPYVEPCVPDVNTAATSSLAQHAPIGIPPPIAFAIVTQSGFTPYPINAIGDPVRPHPVCTSSRRRSIPLSSQSLRSPSINSCVAGCTPPSPCTGSIMIAIVLSVTFDLKSSRLLYSA